MKKLLTLLGIVGVVTTTSTTVIACATEVPEIQTVKEINEISGDLEKILQRRVTAQWTEKELQAEIDLEYPNQGITVEKSKQTPRTFELQKNSWIFIGNATRTNQHHYHGRVKLEHRWNKDTSTDIWEIKDVLTNLVYEKEKEKGTDVLKDYEYKAWTKEALDKAVHDLGDEYAGITVSITKEDDFKWRYTFTGDGDISQEHQYSNHVDVKHILGSETKYIDPTNNEEKQTTNGEFPEGVTEVTQIGWDGNRQVHQMPFTIVTVPNEQDSIHPYIISLSSMFFFRYNGDKAKFNQDLSNWNTSKIIDMSNMFENVTAFEGKGLEKWNVSKVENMMYMFSGSPSFNQNLSEWKTTSLKNMQCMFDGATAFQGNGLESWDVSKVTNMYGTFKNAKAFNCDITNWNTANVTNMGYMFYEAILFDKDIKTGGVKWNTSKVTDMNGMFYGAEKFNGDITNWDTSKVTDMGRMFQDAKAFNQEITTNGTSWNTGNVTNMIGMFYGAEKFNGDITNWDTSKVTDMGRMFQNAKAFTQEITTNDTSWKTGNVTNMTNMFDGAEEFNGDITNWDTSKVTNMSYMFQKAKAFNRDLSKWNVWLVTDFNGFDLGANSEWEDANKPNFN